MVFEGDNSYVFVSYAHKDADTVLPIVQTMMARGFRVWFDSGIEAGTEWPEYIAEHLDGCACFLAFMSEAAAASHNCRREINRAIKLQKPTLVAYIDDASLSAGMEMQLDILQALMRSKFETDAAFVDAICRARILQPCLDDGVASQDIPAPDLPPIESHAHRSPLEGRWPLVMSGIGAFGLVTIIVAFVLGGLGKTAATSSARLDATVDQHLILELENANHQYETGLENWRRLDYARADRDITAAREAISGEVSQSEVEVAKVNNSLGCLYLDMGKYEDAYDYLNAAFVTIRDAYGEESLAARAVRFSIAQYQCQTGDLDGALRELQYIIDYSDPETEQSVLASVGHLQARILVAQGSYDDALAALDKVLDLYDGIVQDGALVEELADYANDPELSQSEKDAYTTAVRWIAQTYNSIGEVYNLMGQSDKALEALQTGLALCLDNVYIGTKNLVTSRLYQNLAVAEGALGQTSQAFADVDLAMRIQLNLFDFEGVYPGLVDVYDAYANLLAADAKDGEALDYYDKAIDLAITSYGENHPQVAAACGAKAAYLLAKGDSEAAAVLFERAIEVRRNMLIESHPDTARLYLGLAQARAALGEAQAGSEAAQMARDLAVRLGMDTAFVQECESVRSSVVGG